MYSGLGFFVILSINFMTVIVNLDFSLLFSNAYIGGQTCTDFINLQQSATNQLGNNEIGRLGIFPRLNFTCNGRITGIMARVVLRNSGATSVNYLQVWR